MSLMSKATKKQVLVPLAPGFEEIEAATLIDVLRRAGIEVTVAGTAPGPLEGANGIRITADKLLDEVESAEFDMIAIPGGTGGVAQLKAHPSLNPLIGEFVAKKKFVAAICAAPTLLSSAGLLCGKQVTSYPSFKKEVAETALYSEERVVVDGKIVTSRGPGTSMEFALKLVKLLVGEETVTSLRQGMLV